MPSPDTATPPIQLGLLENWQQFSLLVLINVFVGGMVGLERTVVPLLAEQEFGLASRTIALSFIVSFVVVKALANLFAGRFSDGIELGDRRRWGPDVALECGCCHGDD